MDILLIEKEEGNLLRPTSIFGMLWLQTHFDDSHWDAIASNQVILPIEDAASLSEDALAAGLAINYLQALSKAPKF